MSETRGKKQATITLPAPKFRYGAKVQVLNYRRKNARIWERGQVVGIEIGEYFGPGLDDWTYTVQLDREISLATGRSSRGPIRLKVGDEAIRAIPRKPR